MTMHQLLEKARARRQELLEAGEDLDTAGYCAAADAACSAGAEGTKTLIRLASADPEFFYDSPAAGVEGRVENWTAAQILEYKLKEFIERILAAD